MHDNFFDKIQTAHGLIGDGFQVHGPATAIRHVRGQHNFGLGIFNAAAQSPGTEASVDHAMNGANAGTGQHRRHPFHGERHVNDHPVAFANPQGF